MSETRQVRRFAARSKQGWQQANQKAQLIAMKKQVPQRKKPSVSEIEMMKVEVAKLERYYRRLERRIEKHNAKFESYRANGLNGPRAVARRKRQILKIALDKEQRRR